MSKKAKLSDMGKIKLQYESGDFNIRELSILWEVPYATLYRILKGRIKKSK